MVKVTQGWYVTLCHSMMHAHAKFGITISNDMRDMLRTRLFLFVCLFVFVALRPKSTAMVIAGRSVHLSTLFPGQA